MDTMSLAVAVVSLLVAAVAAAVAWKVTRADQRRSAARVAMLATAAGVASRATSAAIAAAGGGGDTPTSTEAEVPYGLHEFMPVDRGLAHAPTHTAVDGPVAVGALFSDAAATTGSSGRQQWLIGAAGVFAAVVVAFAGIGMVGSRAVGTSTAPPRTPLELMALSHNRGDGGLAVAGLVRNPSTGAQVQNLEAEVRVFDAAGILIGTRSSRIEAPALAPGQEAPFAVSLGELTTAARYRVSFRVAGTLLPHVDRRTNQPAAVTADAR